MTWKIYVLASGGAFLAYLVTPPPTRPLQETPIMSSPSADSPTGDIDMARLAARLHGSGADRAAFAAPARDAFRFVASPPSPESETPAAVEDPGPIVLPPSRPPFALAGIASDTVDGLIVRTAILSSLGGVLLVHDGESLEGGYRVVAVEEASIVIEATSDGTRTRIGLSGTTAR
jgi:hypothetical protein